MKSRWGGHGGGDGLSLRGQRGAPRRGVEAPLNDYDTASLIHPLIFVKNGLCETGLQLPAEESDSSRVIIHLRGGAVNRLWSLRVFLTLKNLP